jgi:hypothetical protein
MLESQSILSELQRTGFAVVRLDSVIYDRCVQFSRHVFSIAPSILLSVSAIKLGGVLGFYPSVDASERLERECGVKFPQFPGTRDRGYSSFDFASTSFRPSEAIFKCGLEGVLSRLPGTFVTDFFSSIDAIEASMEGLARDFYLRFANGVEVPDFKSVPKLYRALRYDSAAAARDSSKAHTDYELLTMVLADRKGLEVLSAEGQWTELNIEDGNCLILAGDMANQVSGGAVRAAPHRVSRSEVTRHSFVYIIGINEDHCFSLPAFDPPLSFGEFWRSMLVRNCPHFRDSMDQVCKENGLRPLGGNPFRSLGL